MDGIAELGQEILDAVSEHDDRASDDGRMWARVFLARCLDAFAFVRTLVERDRVVDAMAATRVLYEAAISFLYIYEAAHNDDERRVRLLLWRREGLRQFLRRERQLGELELVGDENARDVSEWALGTAATGVETIEAELAKEGAVDSRDANVIDKAKALGLEATYAIVYRESSSAIHTSPMLLGEYLVAGGRGGRRMADYGPMLLIFASRVMVRLCAAVGGVVGVASSERARQYSNFLAALSDG
jgi:hypothetical protein